MSAETINVVSTDPETQKFLDLFEFDTEAPYVSFNIKDCISTWETFDKHDTINWYIRIPTAIVEQESDTVISINGWNVSLKYSDSHNVADFRESNKDGVAYEITFGIKVCDGGEVNHVNWRHGDTEWEDIMVPLMTHFKEKYKEANIYFAKDYDIFIMESEYEPIKCKFGDDSARLTFMNKWTVGLKAGRIEELHEIVKSRMIKWFKARESFAYKIATQTKAQDAAVARATMVNKHDVENPRPLKRRRVK